MAKIPVEKDQQQSSWIWWLVGLLLLLGIVWFLFEAFDGDGDRDATATDQVERTPETQDRDDAESIRAILANPNDYVGQSFPRMAVTVASVPTDRGFWISDSSDSLFTIVTDAPVDQQQHINRGQTLRLNGGTLRDNSYLRDMSGTPLDASTENIAQDQSIFLVIDEDDIRTR